MYKRTLAVAWRLVAFTVLTATVSSGWAEGRTVPVANTADTAPDAFSFGQVRNAGLGSVQTSNPSSISGLDAAARITVKGGSYSVDGGAFTSAAGMVLNNAQVRARGTAASAAGQTTKVTIDIGGVKGIFRITTVATVDTTPDSFSFAPFADVPPGSVQTSAPITVSGVNSAAPISVMGGRYRIGSAAFTDQPGQVLAGDTVVAEVQAAASELTARSATVTIGSVSAAFTVTTEQAPGDREPLPFSFLPVFNIAPGSTQLSTPIRVSGIDAASTVSINGGRYSINGAAFVATSGSVFDGDSLVVEVLAPNAYGARTQARLTIGGVSADFRVGTRAADTVPTAFAFAPATGALPGSFVASAAIAISGIDTPTPISIAGGHYSIDGGPFTTADGSLSPGATVSVQKQAAAQLATTNAATLTVGGISAAFHVTTAGADVEPVAFGFANQPAAFPGLAAISEPVTISGLSATVTAAVSNGEYSVNGAPFLSVAGPVANGDQVRLLVVPGVNLGDVATATLGIGSRSASFSATTNSPADNFSDLVQFREVRAPRNTLVHSEPKRINNINVPVAISITGGRYSINGSAFTNVASTVRGGDLVQLQVNTGNLYDTRYRAMLSIGEMRTSWTVRSAFDPAVIEPFTLATALTYSPDGLLLPGSTQVTEPVMVRTPGGPAAVAVSGGSYSVNGQAFTSAAGTVATGDRVVVAFTAADGYSAIKPVTLSIGNVQSTLAGTTIVDPVAATPTAHEGCVSHVFRPQVPVPLRLFVCYPAGWNAANSRSALIEWFGGSFVTGATDRSIDQARFWANTHGMVGIAPDYRVNDRFGTYAYVAADDVRAALKWVQDNAGSLGIDPARIVLSGNSNGGTVSFLAAVAGTPVTGDAADTPSLRAAAVISRSGSPDISEAAGSNDFSTLARFGGYSTAISPALNLDLAFPPVLILHGDRDDKAAATPVVNVCSELLRLGRICEYNSRAGNGHGLASPANILIVNEESRLFMTRLGLLPAVQ